MLLIGKGICGALFCLNPKGPPEESGFRFTLGGATRSLSGGIGSSSQACIEDLCWADEASEGILLCIGG